MNMLRRNARGLTLIELLLALTITGMVGLAVAGMLTAVTYGTTSRASMRDVVIKLQTVRNRIDAAVRSSKAVLSQGDGYLVLWIADTRGDEMPNISELRLIEFDADEGHLDSYTAAFPENWTAEQITAADTAYDLSTNFYTTVQNLKSGNLFPGTLWATGITDWTITLDDTVAQDATMVSYRITTTIDDITDTAVGAVRMRNH